MIRTAEIPAGQTATAKFYRDGTMQTASFTVTSPPPNEKPGTAPESPPDNLTLTNIGLTISADAPAQIVSVTPDGPAANSGIAVDDTITAIGTETIASGNDLQQTLKTLQTPIATLLVNGDDATGTDPGPRWVAVRVGGH
jgi:S1-C subfamily serine protease